MPVRSDWWDESNSRIAFRERCAAPATAARSTRRSRVDSTCGRERAIQLAILGDHARGRETFRILKRGYTPAFAFFGIDETNQVGDKTFFVIGLVLQSARAGDVRHWASRAAHHRTTTSLRFNDRPAESFKTRGVKQSVRAIVKRFEHFVRRAAKIDNAIVDAEIASLRAKTVAQWLADKDHLGVELFGAF